MNEETLRRLSNLRAAPRCGAQSRAGTPCQCPAVRGRTRCRIHGGLSPGAPRGEKNGNFRHGFWTCEAVQERQWAKEMVELYTKAVDE
ncbi:HGGxSTG domain-containing protein [Bradyrhizobium sp. 18BD]